MRHILLFALTAAVVVSIALFLFSRTSQVPISIPAPSSSTNPLPKDSVQNESASLTNPLAIAAMRARTYPGSDLKTEQTLADGANYRRFIVSYLSDGLKIYGLLTVPKSAKPEHGWPAIVFNHGYVQPDVYRTAERYASYVDVFARAGYIVLKPDYRGNGNSEGQPESAYYSPAYTTDVLNALSSIKRYPDANPERIGMWGHSMGGSITLRSLVVDTADIKAAVIWGGVVGSYDDLMNNWQHKVRYQPTPLDLSLRNNHRKELLAQYGTPKENPVFWESLDPTFHLADVNTPIQLHAGDADEEVPPAFSQNLYEKLKALGKITEYHTYPGGNHNISPPNFAPAMRRSVAFFDKYLK